MYIFYHNVSQEACCRQKKAKIVNIGSNIGSVFSAAITRQLADVPRKACPVREEGILSNALTGCNSRLHPGEKAIFCGGRRRETVLCGFGMEFAFKFKTV
jgi:hypothetical protein